MLFISWWVKNVSKLRIFDSSPSKADSIGQFRLTGQFFLKFSLDVTTDVLEFRIFVLLENFRRRVENLLLVKSDIIVLYILSSSYYPPMRFYRFLKFYSDIWPSLKSSNRIIISSTGVLIGEKVLRSFTITHHMCWFRRFIGIKTSGAKRATRNRSEIHPVDAVKFAILR